MKIQNIYQSTRTLDTDRAQTHSMMNKKMTDGFISRKLENVRLEIQHIISHFIIHGDASHSTDVFSSRHHIAVTAACSAPLTWSLGLEVAFDLEFGFEVEFGFDLFTLESRGGLLLLSMSISL